MVYNENRLIFTQNEAEPAAVTKTVSYTFTFRTVSLRQTDKTDDDVHLNIQPTNAET